MQEDATIDRNVSNRRIFKPTNRLYCENTATVDFVARFFFAFQVSSFGFRLTRLAPDSRVLLKALANRRPQL
jgi:hypothetical protein